MGEKKKKQRLFHLLEMVGGFPCSDYIIKHEYQQYRQRKHEGRKGKEEGDKRRQS